MMNKSSRGFSLIELMVVVSILAIVVAWGYSSYRDTIIKSRRAEGLGELLTLADKLERFYSDQNTYATATLGNGGVATDVYPTSSEHGNYSFSITTATAVQFTITATPQGGQADDTRCGTFTLTSLGVKSSNGSLPNNKCWK